MIGGGSRGQRPSFHGCHARQYYSPGIDVALYERSYVVLDHAVGRALTDYAEDADLVFAVAGMRKVRFGFRHVGNSGSTLTTFESEKETSRGATRLAVGVEQPARPVIVRWTASIIS